MPIRIPVFDMTQSGLPPKMVTLTGKYTAAELRSVCVRALGFADSSLTVIEVRDGTRQLTRKVTHSCVILVLPKKPETFAEIVTRGCKIFGLK